MVPINSMFNRKNTKLPSPWTSKTPKLYKRNTINGDLHRSKRISSNFDEEIPLIKEKFMKADYPLRFINSVVNEFQKGKECGDESFIISPSLFEITKPFIFVEIPYCELNEIKSKHFLKKFHKFTNNSFRMVITWKTRNIRSLFPLKDKNDYKSCVIYKGVCSWGSRCIGETKRVMQRLDGINIIIQLKVQNHQSTFDEGSRKNAPGKNALGRMPPGKLPTAKLPPGKLPPRQIASQKNALRKTAPHEIFL